MTSPGWWERQPDVNVDTSVIIDLWDSPVFDQLSSYPLHVYLVV